MQPRRTDITAAEAVPHVNSGEGFRDVRRYVAFLTCAVLGLVSILCSGCYFTQRQRQVGAFKAGLRHIEKHYVTEVDRTQLHRAAMNAMVQSLDDKYTAYLTPEQVLRRREADKGTFGGIGVVTRQEEGLPLVLEVIEGGPADRAGIRPGDLISRVDGKDIRGEPAYMVAQLIRGKAGTGVELELLRQSTGETFAVTVTREKIKVPNVRWAMLDHGIGRLDVAAFHKHCAGEVRAALGELREAGVKALILDLRGNGGGRTRQARQVSNMLLSQGLIFKAKGRGWEKQRFASPSVKLDETAPVVVLVNRWTASAAEVVAGALQANGRATLMGMRTFGKGTGTVVRRLPDGSGLTVTACRIELLGGKSVEGQGLVPDVVVGELPPFPEDGSPRQKAEWFQQKQKVDAQQLERAVEFLRNTIAAH